MKVHHILMTLAVPILLGSSLFSQKEDNVWILGYAFEDSQPLERPLGGVNLVFNEDGSVDTVYQYRKTHFNNANASICDADGNLMFFTNGNYVSTRKNTLMGNGSNIGEAGNLRGSYLLQGYMILPIPGRDREYYIIYGRWETRWDKPDSATFLMYNLLYSRVDMNRNEGYGKVVEKNVLIVEKEFSWGNITACRHANGRDWWVVVPRNKEDIIEVFLLDPTGIHHYASREIPGLGFINSGVGNAWFSPDGTHYVFSETHDINGPKHIYVFHFDRCMGAFDHTETIVSDEFSYEFAIAISPNSRLLYNIMDSSIYQYDLYADTIAQSKMTVAKYDGYIDRLGTLFDRAVLAPNGKIYINVQSSSYYLHVIEQPNERGVACDVRQHSFRLPVLNTRTMPNFPHFRLGKLEGSICDTLLSSSTRGFETNELSIHPNPASDYITVKLPDGVTGDADATLMSQQGVEVLKARLNDGHGRIDVSGVPPGVYILTIRTPTGINAQVKCVIQR